MYSILIKRNIYYNIIKVNEYRSFWEINSVDYLRILAYLVLFSVGNNVESIVFIF